MTEDPYLVAASLSAFLGTLWHYSFMSDEL
jgi:hypothetical protein